MLRNTDFEIYDYLESIRIKQESTLELRKDVSFLSKSCQEGLNNFFNNYSSNIINDNISDLLTLTKKRINDLFNIKYSFPAFGKIKQAKEIIKNKYKTLFINNTNYNNLDKICNDYDLLFIESSFFIYEDYKQLENLKKYNKLILIDISDIVGEVLLKRIDIYKYGDIYLTQTNGVMQSIDNTILLSNDNYEFDYDININDLIIQAISLKELNNFNAYYDNLLNNINVFISELKNNNYDYIYNPQTYLIYFKNNNELFLDKLKYVGININKEDDYYVISLHALTGRGFKSHEIEELFRIINQTNNNIDNEEKIENLKHEAISLIRKFPLKR